MKFKGLRSLVIACIIGFCGVAQAGEYDGIWVTPDIPMIYFIVYNTDNTLVVTEIDSSLLTCDVLIGQMNGSLGSVQHVVKNDNSYIRANINFTSPTTATLVIKDCLGNCPDPSLIGVGLSFLRIL